MASGEHLGYYRSVVEKTDVPRTATRFAVMILESHTNVDFFGLIRRSAMVGSLLHQPFSGADKAFLAQMALRGHLLQLEEPLVEMREHPAQIHESHGVGPHEARLARYPGRLACRRAGADPLPHVP